MPICLHSQWAMSADSLFAKQLLIELYQLNHKADLPRFFIKIILQDCGICSLIRLLFWYNKLKTRGVPHTKNKDTSLILYKQVRESKRGLREE